MRHEEDGQMFDAIGVGIGPFNLSVAALLQPVQDVRSRFFDRVEHFQWHPGLLFAEATIQVSFIKDLVTLADPTSPYSFLAFLFAARRLYRFINANFPRVTRIEFNQYLRWVAAALPNLEFGRTVQAVSYEQNSLVVDLGTAQARTRNVILGTGLCPVIPECARPHLGATVFHACHYLQHDIQPAGQRVAVIGGGQTGAEVVYQLLSDTAALPRTLLWISRRLNFLPLDESPFTNELFTPAYSDYFFGLQPELKARLVTEQKFASDGVTADLLERIYRRLYELEFLEGVGRICTLYPGYELVDMRAAPGHWVVELHDGLDSRAEALPVDIVVLCTGAEYRLPGYLEPLASRIACGPAGFVFREDFSITWDGPASLKIYVQNAARRSRGIADPNLSLMAWRSAIIVNSLAGRRIYDIREANSVFDWSSRHAMARNGGTPDDGDHAYE